jgi:hypothetical protein
MTEINTAIDSPCNWVTFARKLRFRKVNGSSLKANLRNDTTILFTDGQPKTTDATTKINWQSIAHSMVTFVHQS